MRTLRKSGEEVIDSAWSSVVSCCSNRSAEWRSSSASQPNLVASASKALPVRLLPVRESSVTVAHSPRRRVADASCTSDSEAVQKLLRIEATALDACERRSNRCTKPRQSRKTWPTSSKVFKSASDLMELYTNEIMKITIVF